MMIEGERIYRLAWRSHHSTYSVGMLIGAIRLDADGSVGFYKQSGDIYQRTDRRRHEWKDILFI